MYTIDDTDDANDRLVCTGDNLYADGVRSGDSYKILYDLKNNTDGHNHDGVNSPSVVLPDGTVSVWSDYAEVSGSCSGYSTKATGGDTAYCRLSDGSNVSGQVSRNSTEYGWVDLSTSWDISGLGWTPGTWRNLYVQVKTDYAENTWYIRGVNIVWATS